MSGLITVTATKEHLSAALTPKSMRDVTQACLVTRAIKAAVGRKTVSVYGEYANIDGMLYDISKNGQALVNQFDDICGQADTKKMKKKHTALRGRLPLNFRIKARS